MSFSLDVAGILLDANSPRDAASRTLAFLMKNSRARSIALWRVEAGSFLLEMSLEADDQTILGAQSLWATRSPNAEIVETLANGRSALIPTHGVADSWVYMDDVDVTSLDLEKISEGAAVAVRALRRGSLMSGRGTGFRDLKRDELIATLRLHEWNISRVARVKGVTRKTIYDWLFKYQIPREHVPK